MTEEELRAAILAKAVEIQTLCKDNAPADWRVVNLHIKGTGIMLNVSQGQVAGGVPPFNPTA